MGAGSCERMPTKIEPRSFLTDFANAWNAKDAERFTQRYAMDAEMKEPSKPQPIRGKDNIRDNLAGWFRALSEMSFTPKEIVESANSIAMVVEARARHTGDLVLSPGETIPPTNKNVLIEFAQFLTLDENGRILKDHVYFDLAQMMQQLGLMPSPQGVGVTTGARVGSPRGSNW